MKLQRVLFLATFLPVLISLSRSQLEGQPVIEVRKKEQDLLDEAQEVLSSDSLLDY